MSLSVEIAELRDDALASLETTHDYFRYTEAAWLLAKHLIDKGQRFKIRDRTRGLSVNESNLSAVPRESITGFLASATFQHFVSQFERFVFDLLRLWLTEYPGNLAGNQLKFRTVLDAVDREAIVASVVQKEMHGLAYQRVADWFEYLEKLAKLGCPTRDEIERLAEIKASRDVLVHNNGIANAIYIDKSMGRARFTPGERLELPEDYHRESWELIRKVIDDVSTAAINKVGP
jgi:hypothetical protein